MTEALPTAGSVYGLLDIRWVRFPGSSPGG